MRVPSKRIAVGICAGVVAVGTGIALAQGGGAATPPSRLRAAAFDWLRPASVPPRWLRWRLPKGPARLPVPPGWAQEHGDPGTRTAVLEGPSGGIAAYLNATPQEGEETLANWSGFRVEHNSEEGDREVELLAAAPGLRFRGGRGSCVLDSYRTSSGHRYREIACIVSGRSATTVIVGAAPPARWSLEAPTIERAIDEFTT